MLYRLLKIPAKLCFLMYCRQLQVKEKSFLNADGPLLIACNHPNSFLDAIILSSLFKRPVYSLARGDAFKNKLIGFLLRSLNMLPVFRTSEGVENMEHNYTTFDACKEIFKNNGIVLIFSEGRCINEWKLRPLMKGTARLAISSWEEGIDLKVLPTGINYQSFSSFGKNVHLHFGKVIQMQDVERNNGFGRSVTDFNSLLRLRLEPLVYEIATEKTTEIHRKFQAPISLFTKTLLAMPAAVGYVFHLPLTYPARKMAAKFGGSNDHYDSILIGMLFLAYPIYLIIIAAALQQCKLPYWWLSLVLLPFLGWSYMIIKKQF